MLSTLSEKVHPENVALVVIDMQNDFCSPQGVFARLGYDISMIQEMLPKLGNLIEKARSVKIPIIFVKSTYSTDPNWFLSEVWFEHKTRRQAGVYLQHKALEPGTWGWELVDRLKLSREDALVYKHRYNAFHGTDLDLILRSRKIKSIIFTGMSTNVCVESTARDAFFRDFYVVFTSDCTGSWEKELHRSTLENIEKYFGIVVKSEEILHEWEKLKA